MTIKGYLKIDNIPGESTSVDHEDQIDIFGLAWGVSQAVASQMGRIRARARADVAPVEVQKFVDAASPYLARACATGKRFAEATIYVERSGSGGGHLDYLVITMENVLITAYDVASGELDDPDDRLTEEIALDFENITLRYTQTDQSGAAGDEHEVEISG